MRRLNIFVDETGTFEDDTSLLFGVSFALHEQRNSISKDEYKKYDLSVRELGTLLDSVFQFLKDTIIYLILIKIKRDFNH